jgi:hypothetical protein
MQTLWNKTDSNSRNRSRLLPFAVVLALTLFGVGASSASAAQTSVPFKASTSGTVVVTGPTTFALAGRGTSSHLGNTSYSGVVTITNVATNGVITDTLVETLTAANGDTVTLLCHQVATPVSAGVLHGVDTWTVIGGTGKLKNATGSGTGTTDADLNHGTFTKVATGTITSGK